MKKFLKYTFALAAVTLSLSACTNEEDDIFDGTAADRLNETTAETARILASKPNGWVLQMFTTEREPGYTFLCDFSSNGSVKIAGNHKWIGDSYQEETSLYQMIADNGPGLSFSTYNQVFHILATPEDIGETNLDEQGYGHKGDYEFILMDVTEDRILLKGKKWGQKAVLTPMPADVDWQQYLADLKAEQSGLFSPRIPQFEMVTPQGVYTITHPDYGYFYVVAPGGDMIAETDYVPFVVSPGEFMLWKPYTGKDGEISVENFAIADDGVLRCTDAGAEDVYIQAPSADRLLASPFDLMTLSEDSNGNWNPNMSVTGTPMMTAENVTGNLVDMIDKLSAGVKKYNSRNRAVRYFRWAYQPAFNRVSIGVVTYNVTFNLYLEVSLADGKIQLTDTGTGDNNGNVYRRNVPEVQQFVDMFTAGDIQAESDARLSISKFKVTLADGSAFDLPL